MKRILLLFCVAICVAQTMLALGIEDGKYYTISNRNDVNLYVKDTGVDIIQMGALDDACYWQFIATENTGCYYVKPAATPSCAAQKQRSTLPWETILLSIVLRNVQQKVLICLG